MRELVSDDTDEHFAEQEEAEERPVDSGVQRITPVPDRPQKRETQGRMDLDIDATNGGNPYAKPQALPLRGNDHRTRMIAPIV